MYKYVCITSPSCLVTSGKTHSWSQERISSPVLKLKSCHRMLFLNSALHSLTGRHIASCLVPASPVMRVISKVFVYDMTSFQWGDLIAYWPGKDTLRPMRGRSWIHVLSWVGMPNTTLPTEQMHQHRKKEANGKSLLNIYCRRRSCHVQRAVIK